MTRKSILCVTQARSGSNRLPEKVLKTVLGRPLLQYHLDRLKMSVQIDKVVLATTVEREDDRIVTLCEELGVPCYRGSVTDVLARFDVAVQAENPDIVMRVTSDCPLIDPKVLDDLAKTFRASGGACDYMSIDRGTFPHGLDAEIMSRQAFDAAVTNADNPFEREHVTPYIYRNPNRFSIARLNCPDPHPEQRWTVDYPEDFLVVKAILEELWPKNPHFAWRDVVAFMQRRPELARLNQEAEKRWQERLREARRSAGLQ